MTLQWIARSLQMGPPTHVASLLQRREQKALRSEESLF